jgi:TonB family protein
VSYFVSCLVHVGVAGWLSTTFDDSAISLTTRQGQATIALQASAESVAEPPPEATFVYRVEQIAPVAAAPKVVEPAETLIEKKIFDATDDRLRNAPSTLPTKAIAAQIQMPRMKPNRSTETPQTITESRLPPLERTFNRDPIEPVEVAVVDSVASPASEAIDGADVDEPPRPLEANPSPPYPAVPYAARIEGRVVLRLRITAAGAVESVRIETSSGRTDFDQSALDTARGWRFMPGKSRGVAVTVERTIAINFSFRNR